MKAINVTYQVICDTIEEYDGILISISDSPTWNIISENIDTKTLNFEGQYNIE